MTAAKTRPVEGEVGLNLKFAKVLQRVENVARSAKNTYHNSRYATLEDVIGAIKDVAAEEGLAIFQSPGRLVPVGPDPLIALEVESSLIDVETGYERRWTLEVPLGAKRADPQGFGSAVTYARRYALMAIFGLSATDDDAESAMGRKPKEPMVSGADWPGCPVKGLKPRSAYDLKKDGGEEEFQRVRDRIADIRTNNDVLDLLDDETRKVEEWPVNWRVLLRGELDDQIKYLGLDPIKEER